MLAVLPLRGASLPPPPHERAVWHFAHRKAMASASSRQILVGCGGLRLSTESTKRLCGQRQSLVCRHPGVEYQYDGDALDVLLEQLLVLARPF